MDLTIQGVMTLDAGGVKLDNGATLTIAAGGALNITSKEGVVNTDQTAAALVNSGAIYIIAGQRADYQTTISSQIHNLDQGLIAVQLGNLQLYNGGTWSGVLNIYSQVYFSPFSSSVSFFLCFLFVCSSFLFVLAVDSHHMRVNANFHS